MGVGVRKAGDIGVGKHAGGGMRVGVSPKPNHNQFCNGLRHGDSIKTKQNKTGKKATHSRPGTWSSNRGLAVLV